MAITIILHLMNEDPIVAEIEHLPGATDTSLTINNPRRRDNKPVHYLATGIGSVIFPWNRITFIEIVSGQKKEEEGVVEFFRES